MPYAVALIGLVLVVVTLIDAFEVVLLPRPVRRQLRANHYFFKLTWGAWVWCSARLPGRHDREDFLGVYGPLSMVMIFATWAACLITGFGMLHWALQTLVPDSIAPSLHNALTVSGDAFFTLGYGDIVPRHTLARVLIIVEAGTGFGFIALTIGYLPVLYQHFTRRDVQLIEFAARAGMPPTAATLLSWHGRGSQAQFDQWLRDWELWASELVESHSAYPMLAFYRSQHTGQSWLASLAVVLDTCTLVIVGADDAGRRQASATFRTARRVLDDLTESLRTSPLPYQPTDRLTQDAMTRLSEVTRQTLTDWRDDDATHTAMLALRQSYEPQLESLGSYLLLTVPEWVPASVPAPAIAGTGPSGRDVLVASLLDGRPPPARP